jgi:hypothetical protein
MIITVIFVDILIILKLMLILTAGFVLFFTVAGSGLMFFEDDRPRRDGSECQFEFVCVTHCSCATFGGPMTVASTLFAHNPGRGS